MDQINHEDKDLRDLVELYVDVQNLFEGLTPTRLQKILKGYNESVILDVRRNAISQTLVDLIDAKILKRTNLRVGASPYVADAEEILLEIKGD